MCNREEVVLKKEISVEDAYWYEKAMEKERRLDLRDRRRRDCQLQKQKQKHPLHDPCDQEKNRLFQTWNPHGKY